MATLRTSYESVLVPEPKTAIDFAQQLQDMLQQVQDKFQTTSDSISARSKTKMAQGTTIDKDAVRGAYEDVRNDATETSWLILKYEDGKQHIVLDSTGSDYDQFKSSFSDDERTYGFVRIDTGDELSKRVKFALITWVGPNVSALKRAKMSIDKSVVKSVIANFALEVLASEHEQLEKESIAEQVRKAGGANYGTGVRDN